MVDSVQISPLRHLYCRCGQFGATLAVPGPAAVNRVVCYCRYCQDYARRLGHEDALLDALGAWPSADPSGPGSTVTSPWDIARP